MSSALEDTPQRALAVYAHPDDADVACGGTLARWADAGCETHLLVITDGGKGSRDPVTKPAELARRRGEELAAAASIVGLDDFHLLGWPDGELDDSQRLIGELVEWIRRTRPNVVLGHDPTAVFFGGEYFNHRDHRAAGFALMDAVAPAAALPHYFPKAGGPHQVEMALLSGTLSPDRWVDITKTVDRKVEAVECHRSQFDAEEGWVADAVRRRAAEEGRRSGTSYAEGFRQIILGG